MAQGAAQEHEAKGAHGDRESGDAGTLTRIQNSTPKGRGEPGNNARNGAERSKKMSGLRKANVHRGMPREYRHTVVYKEHRARKHPGSRTGAQEHIVAAGCVRTSVPAGEAMRKPVYASEDERAGSGYRIPGEIRCRLRTAMRRTDHRKAGEQRNESGCGGLRTIWTKLRRRHGKEGLRGARV